MKTRLVGLGFVAMACLLLANCGPKGAADPQAGPAAAVPAEAAQAVAGLGAKPAQIGDCVETSVTLIGPRLEGAPESGSTIQYANGAAQVDYTVLPGITHSKIGDSVRICLVSVPENCPPGDERGRVYAATNLRTGETWNAPDSQHSCGGA